MDASHPTPEVLLPPARPVGRPRTRAETERRVNYDTPEEVQRRRDYMIQYKLANKERLQEYYRAWKETHREEAIEANRVYRARVRQAKLLAKAQAAAEVAPTPSGDAY